MSAPAQALLCRYHYDPLDRLAGTIVLGQPDAVRFYQMSRLATEIQGAVRCSIVQHEDLLLAQQQRFDSTTETTLLATDQQRSVLRLLDNPNTQSLTYNPYGHLPADSELTSVLGFNGEHRDSVTGHYLLGNGYRAYNPVLMRFNSPDSLSPFGEGGINGYAYCAGDPVNLVDPSGHVFLNPYLRSTSMWYRGGSVRLLSPRATPSPTQRPIVTQRDSGPIKASAAQVALSRQNPNQTATTSASVASRPTSIDEIMAIPASSIHPSYQASEIGLGVGNKYYAHSRATYINRYLNNKNYYPSNRGILNTDVPVGRYHQAEKFQILKYNVERYRHVLSRGSIRHVHISKHLKNAENLLGGYWKNLEIRLSVRASTPRIS